MKSWNFNDGVTVKEEKFDYNLHCFSVFMSDKFLGAVYPDTVEDMNLCISSLNAGGNPITDMWEDGRGNTCSANGWNN